MTLPAHLVDPVGHVRDLWPTVGPHTAESITAAATTVEELLRYLAHATRRPDLDLPTLYAVTGSLAQTAQTAGQVLEQLAGACTDVSRWSGLRHDAMPEGDAVTTALLGANYLREGIGDTETLRRQLDLAQQQLAHLYVDDYVDGDDA